jgi:hypothetical protein
VGEVTAEAKHLARELTEKVRQETEIRVTARAPWCACASDAEECMSHAGIWVNAAAAVFWIISARLVVARIIGIRG